MWKSCNVWHGDFEKATGSHSNDKIAAMACRVLEELNLGDENRGFKGGEDRLP